MTGIALGVAAFFVLFWVDPVSLKGMGLVKPVLWLTSSALFVSGVLLTAPQQPRVRLPVSLSAAGWVLVAVFGFLLVYSLFIEIPLAAAAPKGSTPRLVTSGTYALCRHPGVLWLTGLLVGAFLVRGSLWMLAALVAWGGLDVLYVVLQEKLFFVRMFGPDYERYQRSVPMIVPTSRSIRACARTIFAPAGRPRRHNGNSS